MSTAARPAFVEHCSELLSPLGTVSVRRMFGGWGLYVDGLFIALIAFERLYLKADARTREHFAAAGCEPFSYPGRDGQKVTLGYWTAPPDALDAPALMTPWARLALQAALAARAAPAKPARAKAQAPAEARPADAAPGPATHPAARKPAPKARPAAKARRG